MAAPSSACRHLLPAGEKGLAASVSFLLLPRREKVAREGRMRGRLPTRRLGLLHGGDAFLFLRIDDDTGANALQAVDDHLVAIGKAAL